MNIFYVINLARAHFFVTNLKFIIAYIKYYYKICIEPLNKKKYFFYLNLNIIKRNEIFCENVF